MLEHALILCLQLFGILSYVVSECEPNQVANSNSVLTCYPEQGSICNHADLVNPGVGLLQTFLRPSSRPDELKCYFDF